VLQEKVYEPLGATRTVKTNARVIAATHRDLAKLVDEGKFRQDLYFRINVIKLSIPPLAERKEDIPLLVDHFIERLNHEKNKRIIGIDQEAITALMLHDWPGNVRELQNAVEHASVLCREEMIRLRDLPAHLVPENDSVILAKGLTLKEIEKDAILRALQRNSWKKVKTARELGIDKNSLRRKIMRFGIKTP
jgi:DNA-binding NtrC family response regulator